MSLQNQILEALAASKADEVERKKKEADKKYFLRVAKVIDQLDDEEFEKLPVEVRAWHESVIDAADEGDDFPIPSDEEVNETDADPDDDTTDADPDDEEEKTKKKKKKKKKKSKKNKKKKKTKDREDGEAATTDDDNNEEDETKNEDEEEKKPKRHRSSETKPDKKGKDMAKKPAKKTTKKTDKKTDKKTADKGAKFSPDARIDVVTKKNPRREGTKAADNYKLYKTGMKVSKFLEKGGSIGYLRTDVKNGDVKVK